jgi:hypothetical protein
LKKVHGDVIDDVEFVEEKLVEKAWWEGGEIDTFTREFEEVVWWWEWRVKTTGHGPGG